jgi:3-mercaptopyruvate sulfurtransferase SseA
LTCGSGVRAVVADEILQKIGYKNIRIYYGSFDEWREKKGEVEKVNLDIDYDN